MAINKTGHYGTSLGVVDGTILDKVAGNLRLLSYIGDNPISDYDSRRPHKDIQLSHGFPMDRLIPLRRCYLAYIFYV